MLSYYNDGKEQPRSHKVYDSNFPEIPPGYGDTKRQAFLRFTINFDIKIQELRNYLTYHVKEIDLVEVDCLDKPFNKHYIDLKL
jgi:hypothetical protein